jgi:type I restriction enzyme, S subunit
MKITLIVSEIESRIAGLEADNLEKAIDDSLEKSESLRQSILKQAFEGKLV